MVSSRRSCSMLIRKLPDLFISASFRRKARSEEVMVPLSSVLLLR